ncbi:hypothetical protein B484DRAFT_466539, partial [Ochromonadaceae sp. CCMP2298]
LHSGHNGQKNPSDLLTDHTFSNFLLKLGKEHQWKPHFRKAAQAAIRSLLVKAGVPLLFDRMDLWTATHRVLQRWACELKITPYHTKGSTPFTAEVLGLILKLICTTPEEIRDTATVEDVDYMKERNITLKQATTRDPRRIVIVLDKTKNDKSGTGPVSGRTFVLPCLCHLDMDEDEEKVFKKTCKAKPRTPCPADCPYASFLHYQDAKSSFLEANSKGEVRSFTTYKLGIKEMWRCIVRVNARLPEEHQLAKPTGHAGRTTLVTVAVNEGGVDPTTVALASKHRDPKFCAGYIRPDETISRAEGAESAEAQEDAAEQRDSDDSPPCMSQKHALPHHFQPAAQVIHFQSTTNKRFVDDDAESDEEAENIDPFVQKENIRRKNKQRIHNNNAVADRLPTAAAAAVISGAGGASGAN